MIGSNISLRALEPNDIDFISSIENNNENWRISNTYIPYSRFEVEQYILSVGHDIFADRQLRLVIIENSSKKKCGCVDLFDFDARHKRAGIGIIINKKFRSRGIAKEALELMITYSKKTLGLNQLYCHIQEDNFLSIKLFESLKFQKQGTKKQWEFYENKFSDVFFYQLIFNCNLNENKK